MTTRYDAIVVGGGSIGLTSAWRMALRGMHVAVVDPTPGRGASWVAAGMLAPVSEVHYGEEGLLALTMASARRWPAFAAELEADAGAGIGYQDTGTLVVDVDDDDRAFSDDLFAFQTSLGLAVDRLTARRVRELEPNVSPGIRSGMLVKGDHQVQTRRFVAALLAVTARRGVDFHRVAATALDIEGGPPSGASRPPTAPSALPWWCWPPAVGPEPFGGSPQASYLPSAR